MGMVGGQKMDTKHLAKFDSIWLIFALCLAKSDCQHLANLLGPHIYWFIQMAKPNVVKSSTKVLSVSPL
jgi:hypothetical protein